MSIEETKVRFTPDGRTPRPGAAAYLDVKPKTLAEWQRLGKGPMPRKVGGRVFYRRADLEAFVATGAREAAEI
jgi:hypothetical protein